MRLGGREVPGSVAPSEVTAPAAPPAYLFVKDGTRSVRVNFADIQYIEGMKDYVRIHLPDRKVTTLQSLKHLVEVLPATDFIRVHHSYIVGVRWIEEVQRDEVNVAGKLLPVSDTYRGGLREFVEDRELK
nr:LytTR family DNA-binding domain-containing protein [Lewinella sp. JB7]